MSYAVYRFIHFLSIIAFFLICGRLLGDSHTNKKKLMALHGIFSLILLVSGFGLIARLKMHSFPMWLIIKIAIWALLSILLPILISRKVNKTMIWAFVYCCVAIAVGMAGFKPFS